MQDAKSRAGAGFKHLREGKGQLIQQALAGSGDSRCRRAALAGMILAANVSPEEQAALRDTLDQMEGSS